MNRMEPSNRFSAEAVRKHENDGDKNQAGQLNETARQVAAQYRRDTMSPIMVSGVLRIIELALLVLSAQSCSYTMSVSGPISTGTIRL